MQNGGDLYQTAIKTILNILPRTDCPWIVENDGLRSFNDKNPKLWRQLWEPQVPRRISKLSGSSFKHELAARMGNHGLVGLDLAYNCGNQLIAIGLIPGVFIEDILFHTIDLDTIKAIFGEDGQNGFIKACKVMNVGIEAGRIAEYQGFPEGFYIVSIQMTGVSEDRLIAGRSAEVKKGDVLIAISSSGLHCHGYNTIKEFLDKRLITLDDKIPDSQETALEYLLRPTAFYDGALDVFLSAVTPPRSWNPAEWRSGVACIKHGGVINNLTSVIPEGLEAVISLKSWEIPPFYSLLHLEPKDILLLFNGGIGYIWITRPYCKDAVLTELRHRFKGSGLNIWELGYVREKEKNKIVLD